MKNPTLPVHEASKLPYPHESHPPQELLGHNGYGPGFNGLGEMIGGGCDPISGQVPPALIMPTRKRCTMQMSVLSVGCKEDGGVARSSEILRSRGLMLSRGSLHIVQRFEVRKLFVYELPFTADTQCIFVPLDLGICTSLQTTKEAASPRVSVYLIFGWCSSAWSHFPVF